MNVPDAAKIKKVIQHLEGLKETIKRIEDPRYGRDPDEIEKEAKDLQHDIADVLMHPEFSNYQSRPDRQSHFEKDVSNLLSCPTRDEIIAGTGVGPFIWLEPSLEKHFSRLPNAYLDGILSQLPNDKRPFTSRFTVLDLRRCIRSCKCRSVDWRTTKAIRDSVDDVGRETGSILSPYREYIASACCALVLCIREVLPGCTKPRDIDNIIRECRMLERRLEEEKRQEKPAEVVSTDDGEPGGEQPPPAVARNESGKGISPAPGPSAGGKEGTEEKKNKGTRTCTPAEIRAWQSYCWVTENKPELVPTKAGQEYSAEMYEAAISESGLYQDHEGVTIAQPTFDSWKRNIRGYKSKSPPQPDSEDKPRADFRHGEVDNLSEITSKYEHRAD